jgi:hypothetical protein
MKNKTKLIYISIIIGILLSIALILYFFVYFPGILTFSSIDRIILDIKANNSDVMLERAVDDIFQLSNIQQKGAIIMFISLLIYAVTNIFIYLLIAFSFKKQSK